MNKINMTWGAAIVLILIAITTRFLPHAPNFTAIGAMGLFGGAYFTKQRWAYFIPFAALFLSDLVLNTFVYKTEFSAYALSSYLPFALVFLAGKMMLNKVNTTNVIASSLVASAIFFLVSNAVCWQIDPTYTKDFAGLMTSYTAAIPFFWNTLTSDLLYTSVFFGVFAWATAKGKLAFA
jgi:hypothetical protein